MLLLLLLHRGQVVNLVSNDVRRFDEASTFYNFLIGGPLELCIVFVLVGTKLGWVSGQMNTAKYHA